MSQFLNLKFDEDSSDKLNPYGNNNEKGSDESITLSDGPTRTICFVIDNTRRIFFSYAYLICGEYLPDKNEIILTFTTHEVTIKGVVLERLFNQVMDSCVRQIVAKDNRYNSLVNGSTNVNKVEVEKINE